MYRLDLLLLHIHIVLTRGALGKVDVLLALQACKASALALAIAEVPRHAASERDGMHGTSTTAADMLGPAASKYAHRNKFGLLATLTPSLCLCKAKWCQE